MFGMTMSLFPLGFMLGGVLAAVASNELALVVGGLGTAISPALVYATSRTLRETV